MTPQDFTYWLQGFAELHEGPPTGEQWRSIRDHLSLVLNKVTPPLIAPPPEENTPYVAPRVTCSGSIRADTQTRTFC